jgi:hypothetical protein
MRNDRYNVELSRPFKTWMMERSMLPPLLGLPAQTRAKTHWNRSTGSSIVAGSRMGTYETL